MEENRKKTKKPGTLSLYKWVFLKGEKSKAKKAPETNTEAPTAHCDTLSVYKHVNPGRSLNIYFKEVKHLGHLTLTTDIWIPQQNRKPAFSRQWEEKLPVSQTLDPGVQGCDEFLCLQCE